MPDIKDFLVFIAAYEMWVKLTVIALLASAATLLVVFRPAPVVSGTAEKGVVLIDLGYHIFASGLAGAESKGKLTTFYKRLGLTMPGGDVGRGMLDTTKSMLPNERDRQCLDIGAELGGALSTGGVITSHRGTQFEETGKRMIAALATKLRNELESLAILSLVEQNGRIEERITPTHEDSLHSYFQRIDELKASILGAYRQFYGP
ncbi:MAG: hypothetical protein IH977_15680 [Nitrospinae bacterium]|nr:hypothetical protein [Nitrospinota bacterium]